jgi:hypothetical protein
MAGLVVSLPKKSVETFQLHLEPSSSYGLKSDSGQENSGNAPEVAFFFFFFFLFSFLVQQDDVKRLNNLTFKCLT